MIQSSDIVAYARQVGYHKCGVIPVESMAGYEARLNERMAHFPETRRKYEGFRAFAHLRENYPWARAVVICAFWYGKYRIPEALRGRIAKYYLVNSRRDRASEGYRASVALEAFLRASGLRVETERDFGLTALRWAAMQADYGWLRDVLQPKLWYIPPDRLWRYKTNALNAMLNNYAPEYLPVIRGACEDACPQVRDMARWVLDRIETI